MKRATVARVLSALELEIASLAILIGKDMDAEEIKRMLESDAQSDNDALNMMRSERKILYFFDYDDCPSFLEPNMTINLLESDKSYIIQMI